jgi:hypothetical protein
MAQPKKTIVPIDDLERYFDGATRDRIDLTGHSRRVSDLLHLREQLLRLPEDAYEATIAAMRGLLQQAAGGTPAGSSEKKNQSGGGEAARQLYEAARQKAADGASTNASGGSSAARQVSKV